MGLEAPAGPVFRRNDETRWWASAGRLLGIDLLDLLWRRRKVMFATTAVELRKRYSGAILGRIWILLNPILFLSTYLFVYLVILKIAPSDMSALEYMLYMFCGLVPFLAFVDVFTAACVVIRQNTAMIRNVILPVEFLPLRVVFTAMVTQMAGLLLTLAMALLAGKTSWHLLWLPVVLLLQFFMFAGVAMFMASLGVAILDLGPVSGVVATLLMQISPIIYTLSMVPKSILFLIYLNPLAPMMEMFRASIVEGQWPDPTVAAVFVVTSLAIFTLGHAAFARFKDTIDDHV